MGYEYVNRRDERYYLLQGKTPKGKPKYYVSRKPARKMVPGDALRNRARRFLNAEFEHPSTSML